jgi:hypothetical protein
MPAALVGCEGLQWDYAIVLLNTGGGREGGQGKSRMRDREGQPRFCLRRERGLAGA